MVHVALKKVICKNQETELNNKKMMMMMMMTEVTLMKMMAILVMIIHEVKGSDYLTGS